MPHVVLDCFPGGNRKALTMSFDDGMEQDRRLVAIFDRHGIRGTFFLNSGRLDRDRWLRSDEVKDLFARHEVAVHSVNHPCLPNLPREGVIRELVEDRRALERLVGYVVRGMSYPGCDFNDAVVAMLPSLGIEYARTCGSKDDFALPDDFYRWPMSCHQRDAMDKADAFLAIPPQWGLQLFYVMGHSFEFEHERDWERIEAFCRRMAGNDAIWHATNIEIVDYLRAVRSVQCSVDGDLVHNPSAVPVWFSLWEDLPVEVKVVGPGETLRLG